MQWLCSGIGEIWPRKSLLQNHDMSAIAIVYTSGSGFVIGADGRARWSEPDAVDEAKRRMETEDEQKVFELTARQAILALGITGTAYNDDKSFSVVAECQRAAESLSQTEFTNHLEYVERFCEIVSATIAAAHEKDRFEYLPTTMCAPGHENTIVRLLFCGYFWRKPFAYDAEIINRDGTLFCYPTQYPLERMAPVIIGSEKIAKLMYEQQDPRFRNYIVRITDKSPMQDAISCVRGYLEACSTPLARKIDPFCEIVGGHIHIASISPQFGFRWSTRPVSRLDGGVPPLHP